MNHNHFYSKRLGHTLVVEMLPVVEVKGINKSFGTTQVLKDISLSVEKGSFFGLFGPNGAGKTTLLRIITGQLAPDSGVAITMGVTHSDPIGVKRLVGIVPEAETPRARAISSKEVTPDYLNFFLKIV